MVSGGSPGMTDPDESWYRTILSLISDKALPDTIPGRVFEGDQKAARMGGIVAVVLAGPSVNVHDPAWRDRQMARVADLVGKDRRAKSGGQCESTVIARTDARMG
jgi:hypothetical protein